MTITFFSNYLVHHQTPFCEAMIRRVGDGFRFVATEPVPQERLAMGYENLENAPYAVNAYRDDASYAEALRLGRESDVVIIGSAPEVFIEERLAQNKLTFRYHERYFKKFRWRVDPRAWRAHYRKDIRYRRRNLHMLCASAYTASDCRFLFSYPHKTYRWGYFPPLTQVPFDALRRQKAQGKTVRLLWVSRFIRLKHPEEVLRLAQRLRRDGFDFHIEMLGVGELRADCEAQVRALGLDEVISFCGPMVPPQVLEHMQQADIFLFTSDKNEGWGAVMNEAMSSGCAVVACRAIGSVPFLINHGENGLIYDKHGANSLYRNVRRLLTDKAFRETLQQNAYTTVHTVWNADAAAERLLHLIDCIQKGEETGYTFGPCSRV